MTDLTKLDDAIKELEIQSKDLVEFNKVYSEIGNLKSELNENLKLLKKNNEGFESVSAIIHEKLEQFKKQIEKFEVDLLEKIQELYKDNKNFQKELDSSIISRLEKNKSDIQIEIRNEGIQIQRALENSLTSSFNNMETTIKEQFEVHANQLKTLKIILFVLIAIGIGLAIWLYLK